MGITKVALKDGHRLNVSKPVGAEISIIMDRDTGGTTFLTENVTKVPPGVTLLPAHSHVDIEEIVFVLEGEGEAWVDGETCKLAQGDSILYPPNSKHTVTNTGTGALALLCFFSDPKFRKDGAYLTHEDVKL